MSISSPSVYLILARMERNRTSRSGHSGSQVTNLWFKTGVVPAAKMHHPPAPRTRRSAKRLGPW
jgi:hypothetical protein